MASKGGRGIVSSITAVFVKGGVSEISGAAFFYKDTKTKAIAAALGF
jgi:hypothetical protein